MHRVLAFFLLTASTFAQTPSALRIVVIEGEDAVNIVQQKTAVRPIVEVRDRNNLPVAGAVVTFSIEGGGAASFGGASTLTIATNAAGQAAVTSLTPSSIGAFQIQVSAAFQGQVATATIAQTNVMTAAQAAAASAAAGGTSGSSAGTSGGAAGGGGGGVSTSTIVITGAGIAGGTVAALKIAENIHFDETFAGAIIGQLVNVSTNRATGVTCTFTWSVNATVNLEIDDGRGDRAEGHFTSDGTGTIVSQTCGGAPLPDRTVGFGGNFGGTDSAIRGSSSAPFSGSNANGTFQGTSTTIFEGTRTGDTITGVVRFESRGSNTTTTGVVFDNVESGAFPVTWQKTGDKKEGR